MSSPSRRGSKNQNKTIGKAIVASQLGEVIQSRPHLLPFVSAALIDSLSTDQLRAVAQGLRRAQEPRQAPGI